MRYKALVIKTIPERFDPHSNSDFQDTAESHVNSYKDNIMASALCNHESPEPVASSSNAYGRYEPFDYTALLNSEHPTDRGHYPS